MCWLKKNISSNFSNFSNFPLFGSFALKLPGFFSFTCWSFAAFKAPLWRFRACFRSYIFMFFLLSPMIHLYWFSDKVAVWLCSWLFLKSHDGCCCWVTTNHERKKCSFYCFQSVTPRDIADSHDDVHSSKISSSALLHNTLNRTLDWFGRVCFQWRDGRGADGLKPGPQHCIANCAANAHIRMSPIKPSITFTYPLSWLWTKASLCCAKTNYAVCPRFCWALSMGKHKTRTSGEMDTLCHIMLIALSCCICLLVVWVGFIAWVALSFSDDFVAI